MKYLVSYDLVAPRRDYAALIDALERLGAKRVLLSGWVLQTTSTSRVVLEYLRQFIDSDDRLLVNDFADWTSYNAKIDLNTV